MNNVGCSNNYYFIAVKTKNEKSLTCERCNNDFFKTYTGIEYKIGKKVFCSYNCREKYRKEHYNKKEEEMKATTKVNNFNIRKVQIRFTYQTLEERTLYMSKKTIETYTDKLTKKQATNYLMHFYSKDENRIGSKDKIDIHSIKIKAMIYTS